MGMSSGEMFGVGSINIGYPYNGGILADGFFASKAIETTIKRCLHNARILANHLLVKYNLNGAIWALRGLTVGLYNLE